MAWPTDRIETATPASPVKSNITNALQDAVRFGHRGPWTRTLSGAAPGLAAGTGGGPSSGPVRFVITAGGALFYALEMETGERITSLTFALKGNGAADVTAVEVIKTTAAGVDAVIGSVPGGLVNPGAAWADTVVDVNPDVTLAAGETITLRLAINAAGIEVGNIRYSGDRPV